MNQEVTNTVKTLNNNGVILYPTDTVWGIGCLANNPEAIERIFQIKKRPDNKALICLFRDWDQVKNYFPGLNDIPKELISPDRPTSIIINNPVGLPEILHAGLNSLAIRIPNNDFCQKLLKHIDSPIVSTSANISGEPTPTSKNLISDSILEQMDYVVNLQDDSQADVKPSRIVIIGENGEIRTIRD